MTFSPVANADHQDDPTLRSMNDNTRFIRRPRFGVAPPQIDQEMSECSRNLPQA